MLVALSHGHAEDDFTPTNLHAQDPGAPRGIDLNIERRWMDQLRTQSSPSTDPHPNGVLKCWGCHEPEAGPQLLPIYAPNPQFPSLELPFSHTSLIIRPAFIRLERAGVYSHITISKNMCSFDLLLFSIKSTRTLSTCLIYQFVSMLSILFTVFVTAHDYVHHMHLFVRGLHVKFLCFGPDRFGIVAVEDIVAEGALDEMVKGVDAVVYTASPCSTDIGNPQDFIRPATKGTLGILRSVLRYHIVLTSPCYVVITSTTTPRTFSEQDWNMASIQNVEKNEANAPVMVKYGASKTLAERAAWELYEQNKLHIWSYLILALGRTTNNHYLITDTHLRDITGGPVNLNTTLKFWYDAVLGEGSKSKKCLSTSSVEDDVRDAALAHVFTLQKEVAGGERIIIAGVLYVDIVNTIKPCSLPDHPLSKGFQGLEKACVTQYDRKKQERIFYLTLRTMEETARDILPGFSARGW
ncbi:hypothetical protein AN958_04397 [Leucoagaricus sp. SymC.cos]|nr:hypothetical protein AN958_04397 [Leucoagaricus sp. SymC.cos]